VKCGSWIFPLAFFGFLIGSFYGGLPSAQAQRPCTGAPVTLTSENFQRPTCIFVRSRECPQSPRSRVPRCNFRFEHYGADGLYHPVSGESLFRALPEDIPVLILVHGSFVDIDEEPYLLETFQWIRNAAPDEPLLVLCYRWPSSIGFKVIFGSFAVCELAQRAEFNGFYLTQLINRIPKANSVRLMGHSHGCRMIASALHLLAGGRVNGVGLPARSWSNRAFRVTFLSAAIDHDWLNPDQKYGLAINRMSWLQNHVHPCDWALLSYPFRYPGSSRALGQTGFTRKDMRRLGPQAAKIQQLKDSIGRGLLRCRHSLKSYLLDPAVIRALLSNIFSP